MPRTSSILDSKARKARFGALIKQLAKDQDMKSKDVAAKLDPKGVSNPRSRLSDWSRITSGERVPTPYLLRQIALALRVPENVLLVSTGYIDQLLECCYTVALKNEVRDWPFEVIPRRAAFALLFSLFPCEGIHIDNRCTLLGFMRGTVLFLNLDKNVGVLTGEDWNATWLYPAQFRVEHLIEQEYGPNVRYVNVIPGRGIVDVTTDKTNFRPTFFMRAEVQVDLASPVASALLAVESKSIPAASGLFEAKHILHAKSLSLELRASVAGAIIHEWADKLDATTAAEVREHLQQWQIRSLTSDAVRWIRGETNLEPDDPWL